VDTGNIWEIYLPYLPYNLAVNQTALKIMTLKMKQINNNHPQHQGLFKGVSFSHQVAKVLEFQLQHQSFQLVFRTDFL